MYDLLWTWVSAEPVLIECKSSRFRSLVSEWSDPDPDGGQFDRRQCIMARGIWIRRNSVRADLVNSNVDPLLLLVNFCRKLPVWFASAFESLACITSVHVYFHLALAVGPKESCSNGLVHVSDARMPKRFMIEVERTIAKTHMYDDFVVLRRKEHQLVKSLLLKFERQLTEALL